nr:hypothetical protein [Methylibium sp.]
MCYSAQVVRDYRRYTREYGAQLDLKSFVDIFWRRQGDSKVKIPEAMQAAFQGHEPADEDERRIRTLIEEFASEQASKLEQELFAQRKRLADAERALEAKPTKAAAESKRIAT